MTDYKFAQLLHDDNVDAAVEYLKTVKPISNVIAEMDAAGMLCVGLYNCSRKSLIEKATLYSQHFTKSAFAARAYSDEQSFIRDRLLKLMEWSKGNRNGFCGGPVRCDPEAGREVKQKAYAEDLREMLRNLDRDFPENSTVIALVEAELDAIRLFLLQKKAEKA